MIHLIVVLTLVILVGQGHTAGSCKEAKMCCRGRDSSCVVQKAPINAIIEDLSDKPCYCDHACLKVGDCCKDFKEHCGVKDCLLSDWGRWSKCDTKCGVGKMHRERKVIRYPENGGKQCGHLRQNRGCVRTSCSNKREKAGRAVAIILPSTFKTARTVNASRDIRKNLRLKYPKDPEKEQSKDYCVVFEVLKSSGVCKNKPEYSSLFSTKGKNRVCVSCEGMARRKHFGYKCRGHGMNGRITRWKSMTTTHKRCHGRWIQREVHVGKCPCNETGSPDYIFI